MANQVFQKNDNDCMLACIAMAAGKGYDELWPQSWVDEVVEQRGASNEFTNKALEHAGFKTQQDCWKVNVWDNQSRDPMVRRLLSGRSAILSVPSLNWEGGLHVVFWDGASLFDPNDPATGKQVYRWIDQLAPREIWIFDERG